MPVFRLLHSLYEHARHVLEDLHRRPDTDEGVQSWAVAHRLNSDAILAMAANLRHNWALDPEDGPQVPPFTKMFSTTTTQRGVVPGSAEDSWCETVTTGEDGRAATSMALPDPEETETEWIARAKTLYYERAAVRFGTPTDAAKAVLRQHHRHVRDHNDRFYQWFIEVHVVEDGLRPCDVAKRDGVDRATVERETKRLATQLGLRRRTWPRGRRVQWSAKL